MIILELLFPCLLVISLIYFRSKRPLKWLKYLGILLGFLLLPLYFFARNFGLAFIPVHIIAFNKTSEKIQLYYISYLNKEPIVVHTSALIPTETSKYTFEAEGFERLWAVAVNESNEIVFFDQRSKVWSLSTLVFTIRNDPGSISTLEKYDAIYAIRKFRLKRTLESAMLWGSIILLVLLIAKRKNNKLTPPETV